MLVPEPPAGKGIGDGRDELPTSPGLRRGEAQSASQAITEGAPKRSDGGLLIRGSPRYRTNGRAGARPYRRVVGQCPAPALRLGAFA